MRPPAHPVILATHVPSDPASSDEVEPLLADVGRAVARRWWLIIIATIAAGVIAYVVVHREPIKYTGAALVSFSSESPDLSGLLGVPNGNTGGTETTMVDTAASLAVNPSLAHSVALKLGHGLTAAGIDQDLTARANTLTDIISFDAKEPTPGLAELVASTYAAVYAKQVNAVYPAAISHAERSIRAKLASIGGSSSAASERSQLLTQLAQLSTLSALVQPRASVEPAASAAHRSGTSASHAALYAALVALLASLILAVALDRLDPRVHSRDDVARVLRLPYLGSLGGERAGKGGDFAFSRLMRDVDFERLLLLAPIEQRGVDGSLDAVAQIANDLTSSGLLVCVVDFAGVTRKLGKRLGRAADAPAPNLLAVHPQPIPARVGEGTASVFRGPVPRYEGEAPRDENQHAQPVELMVVEPDSLAWLAPSHRPQVDAALNEIRHRFDVVLALGSPLNRPRNALLLLGPRDAIVVLVRGGERRRALEAARQTLDGISGQRAGAIGLRA